MAVVIYPRAPNLQEIVVGINEDGLELLVHLSAYEMLFNLRKILKNG